MKLRNMAKRVDFFYQMISCTKKGGKRIFHPEYTNRKLELNLIKYFVNYGKTSKIVDYGCGLAPYKFVRPNDWYGVDIQAGSHVDMIIDENDFSDIPINYSHLLCTSVLEHIEDIENFRQNFEKHVPAGTICLFTVPFLVQEHGAPKDFRRFTTYGLEQIFEKHTIIKSEKLYGLGFCFSRLLNSSINTVLYKNKFTHGLRIFLLPIWMTIFSLINIIGKVVDFFYQNKNGTIYNSAAIIFVKIN